MSQTISSIIEDFEFLDDWEDKYRYVIELGKKLDALGDAQRTDANKVNGCVSQVWLSTQIANDQDHTVIFRGASDAHIVSGLIAIMIIALSNRPAAEIVDFNVNELLEKLGLDSHLTPQRSNGLRAMVDRMKSDARAAIPA